MFRHTDHLQFDVAPEKPDPVYARKLQELIGGAYGEMTVTMQYLFQGWNCRMKGKYKDLIMDIVRRRSGRALERRARDGEGCDGQDQGNARSERRLTRHTQHGLGTNEAPR